jgi:hypothetical protein
MPFLIVESIVLVLLMLFPALITVPFQLMMGGK